MYNFFSGFTGRPKKLLVFLQPYAGKKTSRLIYNSDVLPLFEKAGVTVQYIGTDTKNNVAILVCYLPLFIFITQMTFCIFIVVEVNHNEHIKHEVIHMDTENVDW